MVIAAKHFEVLDLTPDDIIQATVVFSLIIVGTFVLGLIKFQNEKRKLSWVISVLGSSTMLLAGGLYLANIVPRYPGMFRFQKLQDASLFLAVDNFAAYTCLWFALINLFDLALGAVFYRKYLDPLTALVHHPVFIWIMYSSTTGRSFYLQHSPYARLFMLMAVEELPTFLLGFGSIVPLFRTDLGFGVTFFLLRILYHVYFFVYAYLTGIEVTPLCLFVLTLTLHVFWFKNWITKYGKKFLASQKDKEKAF